MKKYQQALKSIDKDLIRIANEYSIEEELQDVFENIETLKEMIDKVRYVKPFRVHNNVLGTDETYITYKCPNCNKVVGFDRNDKVPTSIYARDEWCECHALMDWSDEDE